MKNRLRYGDIEKPSYIKNVLTLILIVAFICVTGRFLYKYIKQELSNEAKSPVKQKQVTKITEVTQEQKKVVEEPAKINIEKEAPTDIKPVKETKLPEKPAKKDDTIRPQLKEHVTQTENTVVNIKYSVYVGSYSSREQANQARDVICDSYNDLSPVVKQLGADNYSLLIKTYNSKSTAEIMYNKLKNDYHYPAKIIEERY